MAATNIDEVFSRIEKDFIELSKNAARAAANKAQEDIRKKADQFIGEYYQYKPVWYNRRKKALYKLVQNYYKEVESQDGLVIEFGVKYDPTQIEGIHRSYSKLHQTGSKWISRDDEGFKWESHNNGIPEAEWIAEQFIEGIHPWAQTDSRSPDDKMQKFFNTKLNDLVMTYMNKALLNAVQNYF